MKPPSHMHSKRRAIGNKKGAKDIKIDATNAKRAEERDLVGAKRGRPPCPVKTRTVLPSRQ